MDVASAAAGVLVGLALVGGVILFICGLLLIGQSLMWTFGRLYGYWKDRQGGSGAGAGAGSQSTFTIPDSTISALNSLNTAMAAAANAAASTIAGAGAYPGAFEEIEEGEDGEEVDSTPRIGWKGLHLRVVNGQPLLVSPHQESVWLGSPPRLQAVCTVVDHRLPVFRNHVTPNSQCTCGIYSLTSDREAESSRFGPIKVRVRHFGRTIVGELGYRSEIAVVEAVTMPRCRSCWRRADVVQIGTFLAKHPSSNHPSGLLASDAAFSCGWHYYTYTDKGREVPEPHPIRAFFSLLDAAELLEYPEPRAAICPHCSELYPEADGQCFNCAGAHGGRNGGYHPAKWDNSAGQTQAQVGSPNPYFSWSG